MHKEIAVCMPCSYHDDIIKMETFSALLAICAGNSPVTNEFPTQRPVTWSFHVFFDLRLNKRLSKQKRRWWFETLSCPLWCHCNALILCIPVPHFCIYLNHHCFRWCPVPYLVPNHYLNCPDSKIHGANMGPIWGRQDQGGPHVGPMNFAILAMLSHHRKACIKEYSWKTYQNIRSPAKQMLLPFLSSKLPSSMRTVSL